MRNRSFLIAALVAALLAGVVWLCVPDSYVAITTVRDENKEVDLAIGLDRLTSQLKRSLKIADKGINNIDVYCQILTTRDFARALAQKRVPQEDCSYGEWTMRQRWFWQSHDTLDIVGSHIDYNISSKSEMLTIGVTDGNPLVAAQMLDSVTDELQRVITATRRKSSLNEWEDVKKQLETTRQLYDEAQTAYAAYCDTHRKVKVEKERQEMNRLNNEVDRCRMQYLQTEENYIRQLTLSSRDYYSFAVIKSNTVPQKSQTNGWVLLFVFEMVAIVFMKACHLLCDRRREKARWEWGGWFSPWTLTLVVWGGMGLITMLSTYEFDPLTPQFFLSISLWVPILVITSFLTFNLLPHRTCTIPTDGVPVNSHIYGLLFFVAAIFSPMYAYRVWQVVSLFGSEEMLSDVRNLAVFGSGQGIFNYAIVISQSLLLVSLWRYPKIAKWQLAVVILCCMVNSLAIMEKGSLFFVILCGIYVLYERGVVRGWHIVLFGTLTVLFFYLFNMMRDGEQYSNKYSLFDFFSTYVLSPPVAFCRVRQEITDQFGTNTLETIYLFLNRLGANVEVHEKTQEFVYVPVYTNVYTIMQPFFRDFGYFGVAFFAWVYGLMSGMLYRFSCNGNPFYVCLYTYMVYVLILQFYQENLFLSIVFVLQLVFFVWLLTQSNIRFRWHNSDSIKE